MAHFARIDADGIVRDIVVVANAVLLDDGQESEAKGVAFCQRLFGGDDQWVQTSYTASKRGKYAAIGDRWDGAAFAPPPAPETVTVTKQELADAGLDAKAIETLSKS